MDLDGFDELSRATAGVSTRRRVGALLLSLGLGASAGVSLLGAAETHAKNAKKRKRKQRRRRKRAQRALDQACQAICGENCAGCQETCGAACGDCPFCYHQTDGSPLCAMGSSWSGCPAECTATSDCGPGQHCVTGNTFTSSGTTERVFGACEYSVGVCITVFSCVVV